MGLYKDRFTPVSGRQTEGFSRAAAEMKAYLFAASKAGFDEAVPEEQVVKVRVALAALGGFSLKVYNEMTSPYVAAFQSKVADPKDQAAVRQYAAWLMAEGRNDANPPRFVSIEGMNGSTRFRASRSANLVAGL